MELSIEIYPAKEDTLQIINAIANQLRAMKKAQAISEYKLAIKTDSTETYSVLEQELEEAQEIEIVEG